MKKLLILAIALSISTFSLSACNTNQDEPLETDQGAVEQEEITTEETKPSEEESPLKPAELSFGSDSRMFFLDEKNQFNITLPTGWSFTEEDELIIPGMTVMLAMLSPDLNQDVFMGFIKLVDPMDDAGLKADAEERIADETLNGSREGISLQPINSGAWSGYAFGPYDLDLDMYGSNVTHGWTFILTDPEKQGAKLDLEFASNFVYDEVPEGALQILEKIVPQS